MKNPILVVSLVLLLCFAFGCQNKAEKAELEKYKAQAALEEQNKALVTHAMEAWNKGDFDALREVTAPEYVGYLPSKNINFRSLEELIEYGKTLHISFLDVAFSNEELYAVGDRVILRYIFRGTHQGEFAGVPAAGNKVEISGIGIWRIENGKIVELREEPDMLGFWQQLGMELRPKEVKK